MNTKISVGILNSDSTITCMIFNYTVFGKFMTQPKFMGSILRMSYINGFSKSDITQLYKTKVISKPINFSNLTLFDNFAKTCSNYSYLFNNNKWYYSSKNGKWSKLTDKICYDDTLVEYLSKVGFDELYGARPLKRAIQDKIEDLLSEEVLTGKMIENKTYNLKVDGETVVVEKKGR